MKILFVQSYLGGKEPPVFPLGISCLAAQLSGHDISVFDTNISGRPFEELKERIKDFSPEVICISLRNIDSTNKRKVVFYYEYLKETIELIKRSSGAKIIIGGSGFSMFAREIMEDEPGIDYGVYLEGEGIIADLLDHLFNPEKIKGIFYRKEGEVIFTGPAEQVVMNNARLPERHLFRVDEYKKIPEAIGIETKRGCALKCVYCIYGFLNGNKYRLRDPKRIADEIEMLAKEYGVNRFTFVDSVFNIPRKHAAEICQEIIGRGIKTEWSAWFSESGLNKDIVMLAIKAGCRKFILSPDGFTDRALRALEKNITQKDILTSYHIFKDFKEIEVSYNFFKNPPGQTFLGFLYLIFFFVAAKMQMGRRVHFEFNSMRIEPHTKLYKVALEEGFVKKGESLLFPKYYTSPGTWYIEKIFNLLLRLKGR